MPDFVLAGVSALLLFCSLTCTKVGLSSIGYAFPLDGLSANGDVFDNAVVVVEILLVSCEFRRGFAIVVYFGCSLRLDELWNMWRWC